MALTAPAESQPRPRLGELLQGVAAALRVHVESAGLGPHVERHVLKALSTDGRLLETEDSAALATLVMLAAEAVGADAHESIPAAVSMECLMAAADILDDIQDDEWDLKGWESPAVASETLAALLVLAHGAITSAAVNAEDPRSFVRVQARLVALEAAALRGQAQDVRQQASRVQPRQVLEITRAKSGSLGRCAAEMGASLRVTDENLVRLFGDFGEHVAVVFQLMNDIAGIWPNRESGSDFEFERPTPVLGFFKNAAPTTKLIADSKAGKPVAHELVDVGTEAIQSGAVQFAWALAAVELGRASKKSHLIETLFPESRLAVLLQR